MIRKRPTLYGHFKIISKNDDNLKGILSNVKKF